MEEKSGKMKENNSDGHHGAKPEHKHRTEAIGIIVSRPYAPAGVKKEGEGEGFKCPPLAHMHVLSRECHW